MIGSFGWMELLLILFIVLIIFGAGKIPQLGEGLGKAIKGFKKSINESDAMDVTPQEDAGTGTTGAPQPDQIAEPATVQTAVPPAQAGEPVPQPQQQGPATQPESQVQEPRKA